MVKFSAANVKIQALKLVAAIAAFLVKRKVYSFDLLSGFSCPFAEECLSKVKVNKETGKRQIHDGPKTKFRCFSASQEVVYTNTYNRRKENFDSLKGYNAAQMFTLISDALPKNLGVCRIHVAGDFFSQDYFDAWLAIAIACPDRLFYAYTKSLTYWLKRRDQIPANFVLTASYGGRLDSKIESEGLRSAKVVFSEQEASDLGLEIDHDDSHAADPSTKDKDFALLIHGVQPKGSDASTAIKALKKDGVQFSYSREKKVVNA